MTTAECDPAGFTFVYVNQDGSVRKLSPGERSYLSTEFSGADGGRPYIKSSYESRDGWGSQSGFIERHRVPAGIAVEPVHPRYDDLERQLGWDILDSSRAAGDIIVTNPDGSITCKPNPAVADGRQNGWKAGMKEVPISATSLIPDVETSWFEEQLRPLRTLADVLDWLRRQTPARTVTEILTQDEYTHDVVVEWNPSRFLVFDAT